MTWIRVSDLASLAPECRTALLVCALHGLMLCQVAMAEDGPLTAVLVYVAIGCPARVGADGQPEIRGLP